jgi:1,5-anhydro-D-fructose reductase (1,5-anhydro-D-mannitol-forming)
MKKIRYGIIGFGNFAEKTILPAIRASANSEVVALQKRSSDAARAKAREHGVPHAFGTVEELVRHPDVDSVFIVSANACHYPETVAAARAGKHVLVEKPMALSVREAEEMIRVCREQAVKLMVGHMVRLSPAVVRMKELIHSGALGRVTFVKAEFVYNGRLSKRGWLRSPSVAGGGPVFDVGVHCLDTMRFLLNDEVVSVKSQLSPKPSETQTESTASLSLQFSRGSLGSIYCSYESSIRRSFIEIVGTDASAYAYEFTRCGLQVDVHVVRGKNDSEAEHRIEPIDVPDLYEQEVSLFSKGILTNSPVPIPGEEGLANQRVLNTAVG